MRALSQGDLYERLGSRTIKYLLSEYEIRLRRKVDVPLAVATQEKILSSDYEVEHIWAQHPSYEMGTDEESEHQQNVHRLGNLTIASQSWNKSMGNKTFQEKQCQPGRYAQLLKFQFAGTEGASQASLLGCRRDQRSGGRYSGICATKVVHIVPPSAPFPIYPIRTEIGQVDLLDNPPACLCHRAGLQSLGGPGRGERDSARSPPQVSGHPNGSSTNICGRR